jgi:hypothetical protein
LYRYQQQASKNEDQQQVSKNEDQQQASQNEDCDEQLQFDMLMCKSHMCTDCILAWCTTACQKVQKDYPTCRCKDWPKSQASYSTGDFAGKGKFGDSGDYAKGDD